MAGSIERWPHMVHGFGSHVQMKAVEFVDKLECCQVCNWCGLVSSQMYRLSCRHVLCDVCKAWYSICNKNVYYAKCCECERICTPIGARGTGDKRVRCVYADSGCDFLGPLKQLDEHLRESCALYSTVCHRCGDTFAHKDMRIHYPTCAGRQGVFLRSSHARSALDNLSAACEKFETAVASAGPEEGAKLRDMVTMVREQFTRIQGQLATGTAWHLSPTLDV
ncbi:hypothetical protein HPB51_026175 [Rhipicephalus microplus]|uniref:Tnf receptor-associated factor n=1 Tax=Rhipicephalus microplus TaxID=6941 RepID=A0A9J6EE83_RHIMP|nr:hypothetical protein HPB51_026175 [Rhipicephalus microplus]